MSDNYVAISGSCYYIELKGLTYADATLNCPNKLGNNWVLFEPREASINTLVYAAAGSFAMGSYWCGIDDFATQHQYVYASDGQEIVDGMWQSGQPNGANDRCVAGYIVTPSYLGGWYDENCGNNFKSICQVKNTGTGTLEHFHVSSFHTKVQYIYKLMVLTSVQASNHVFIFITC